MAPIAPGDVSHSGGAGGSRRSAADRSLGASMNRSLARAVASVSLLLALTLPVSLRRSRRRPGHAPWPRASPTRWRTSRRRFDRCGWPGRDWSRRSLAGATSRRAPSRPTGTPKTLPTPTTTGARSTPGCRRCPAGLTPVLQIFGAPSWAQGCRGRKTGSRLQSRPRRPRCLRQGGRTSLQWEPGGSSRALLGGAQRAEPQPLLPAPVRWRRSLSRRICSGSSKTPSTKQSRRSNPTANLVLAAAGSARSKSPGVTRSAR